MLEPMEPLDEDAKLMVRYRDGDADAFSTLYARHKGPLYRYLLRQVRNAGAVRADEADDAAGLHGEIGTIQRDMSAILFCEI